MKSPQEVAAIIRRLKELYPDAACSLDYGKDYELLFSVRLAAQCTDARVNQVTPALFARFPTLEAFAAASPEEVGEYVRSCGFWRAKARDIVASAQMLLSDFGGRVPDNMEDLLRLPGATGAPLRTTVDKLCALKADKAYGSDLLAQSALVELLVGLNRAAAERGDARPTGTSDQVVDAVLHYINEHYSEALTLDQLSEKFFISKYHLLRKFDAQVGTTVHRYILQKRLLNAKQLLAGGVPPNEVCQYCGFGDYANFYRAFRAEYNQTPRQYIQSARGK